jgi:hypothetical protein
VKTHRRPSFFLLALDLDAHLTLKRPSGLPQEADAMLKCTRCQANAISRVLTVSDIQDETPEGELISINFDAWTMGLCLSCASDAQRMLEQWASDETR